MYDGREELQTSGTCNYDDMSSAVCKTDVSAAVVESVAKEGTPETSKAGETGWTDKGEVWYKPRDKGNKQYANILKQEGDFVYGHFKAGNKKIEGMCAKDMGKILSARKSEKDTTNSPRSIASQSSSGRSRALTASTTAGTDSDNTGSVRRKYTRTRRITVETLRKDYPSGVDPDMKPETKIECRRIVEDIPKLRDRIKSFTKSKNPLKEEATRLLEVMKQKSKDFRSQPGNRYTRTEEIAEAAGSQIVVQNKAHAVGVKDLKKLGLRAINIAEDMLRFALRVEESHGATVEAGQSMVKAIQRDAISREAGFSGSEVEEGILDAVIQHDEETKGSPVKKRRRGIVVKEEPVVEQEPR